MKSVAIQRRVGRFLLALIILSMTALLGWQRQRSAAMPDFQAACQAGEPWFVTASLRGQARPETAPGGDAPSIALFQDTATDSPHYALASYDDVGSVFGLGYSRAEQAVYAAAYRKRGLPLGPLGTGGIYRVDLNTGDVTAFATVPEAGDGGRPEHSNGRRAHDDEAMALIGRTGLGDLELSSDERELYVTNLGDRRIYRYALPDGQLLGSFAHGAEVVAWAETARPFGLAYWKGHLYHGVVNAAGGDAAFVANVYRSKPDGSEMKLFTSLPLTYPRDPVRLGRNRNVSGSNTRWSAWEDSEPAKSGRNYPLHSPQPMLSDIVFDESGRMAIGLRDRYWDITNPWIDDVATYGPTVTVLHNAPAVPPRLTQYPPEILAESGMGFGDLLKGDLDSNGEMVVETEPEFFQDVNELRHEESAFGTMACIAGSGSIASTHFGVEMLSGRPETRVGAEGVYWYELATGNRMGHESLYGPGEYRDYEDLVAGGGVAHAQFVEVYTYIQENWLRDLGSLGDIEALCGGCEIVSAAATATPEPPPAPDPVFIPKVDRSFEP